MQHRKFLIGLAAVVGVVLSGFVVHRFVLQLEYRRGGLPEMVVAARGIDRGELMLTYWQDAKGLNLDPYNGTIVRQRDDGTKAIGRMSSCVIRQGVCKTRESQKLETLYVGATEQVIEVWEVRQPRERNAVIAQLRWTGSGHPRTVKLDCDFSKGLADACRMTPA